MSKTISVSMFVSGVKRDDIVNCIKHTHPEMKEARLQVNYNPRSGFLEVSSLNGVHFPDKAQESLRSFLAPYEVARPQIVAMPSISRRTAKQIVSAMAGRRRMSVGF